MPLEVELDLPLARRLVAVGDVSGDVDFVERLSGGMGSAVFAVRVGLQDVVVKIYPDVARAGMRKELWVCEYLQRHAPSIPVPKVLGVDESGRLIPQAFSVLTRVPGVYLRSQLSVLSEADVLAVYQQVGQTLRALHDVHLAEYGEVMAGRGRRFATNSEFMRHGFEDGFTVFAQLGGDSSLLARLTTYVAERSVLMDGKSCSSFCHNDGHDANLLVAPSPQGWLLTGVLDFEHAVAAEPLFDLAKTFYFAPQRTDALLAALTEPYEFSANTWRETFDVYLTYHQLQLWTLLARLNVTDRLPTVAAEINEVLSAAGA